ncbi:MAG: 2-hydroxyacid dehydrogenase [Planctomycetota bacterium]|jgi:glyoxylate reductase
MAEKPRVYVALKISPDDLERIREVCELEAWDESGSPPRATVLEKIVGCQGVITASDVAVNAEFFDAAGPQLKVVSNTAVGTDNFDFSEAAKRGVLLGHTPGVLTEATASMAFVLMQDVARKVTAGMKKVAEGQWKIWSLLGDLGKDLHDATVGIVGLGRIGAEMARLCSAAYRMRVLYYDTERRPAVEESLQASRVNRLEDLCGRADFISVHVDLNPATHNMFGARQFAAMQKDAVFVNTSRGPVVDQDALYIALTSNQIRGAGLDVTVPEPLPPTHPLVGLPNCVISPHQASATPRARLAMSEIATDNLLLGLCGEPLRCPASTPAVESE